MGTDKDSSHTGAASRMCNGLIGALVIRAFLCVILRPKSMQHGPDS